MNHSVIACSYAIYLLYIGSVKSESLTSVWMFRTGFPISHQMSSLTIQENPAFVGTNHELDHVISSAHF